MLNTMPFEEKKAIFAKLGEMAETGALSKEDREKYEYSLKVARDNYATMEYEKMKSEEKGRAEAEAKHKQERVANVKALLANGVNMAILISSMNLTPEEIEQVKS